MSASAQDCTPVAIVCQTLDEFIAKSTGANATGHEMLAAA
jgi:hypothetical protein